MLLAVFEVSIDSTVLVDQLVTDPSDLVHSKIAGRIRGRP
jgi:hypothetical protein